MTITEIVTTPTVGPLTELAVRYALEVDKALLAGDHTSVLMNKLEEARTAAQAEGATFTYIHRQADERLIQEIRNRWEPGYIATLALDGDLDHPINALGDRIDLTGAAA